MEPLQRELKKRFSKAILDATSLEEEAEVTQSTREGFGHYQCNSAMKLAKGLKRNPREVAAALVEAFDKGDLVEKLEIAGPGFINIFLSTEALSKRATRMASDSRLGIPEVERPKRTIVEFSSPNIAKEMHVGHLRSTIIGDSLARMLEFLGHDVLRLNHVGDWGTQFGMLIAYIKEEHPEIINDPGRATLPELMGWYRASKAKFDADPAFKKRSQLEVVALQGGDPSALKVWEQICEISRRAYGEIYSLLDTRLTERGESFYNPELPKVVEDLEKKGLVTVSEGAKCLYLEGFTNREGDRLPMIIVKSDGGYNYSTTDMAAIRHRIQQEGAEWIIVITDAGQATHFKMIAAAAEKAGYLDPKRVRFDHITFGLVLGPDGKKFRTRSGETERLIDLLNTAVEQARAIFQERIPEASAEELGTLAHALGIGAIKYADLSCHRAGDYLFSYDRMLRFEGNTAAFLLYAYVRINGIKRKIGAEPKGAIALEHPSEIALALHLAQFAEALEGAVDDLLPSRLTDYLYGLAEKFNAFHRDCRVAGDPKQESRLSLCQLCADTLKLGLNLLGLQTVERM
ncbi:MAG: arginine--tRNA ligase [Parachlamydiales bacterium]